MFCCITIYICVCVLYKLNIQHIYIHICVLIYIVVSCNHTQERWSSSIFDSGVYITVMDFHWSRICRAPFKGDTFAEEIQWIGWDTVYESPSKKKNKTYPHQMSSPDFFHQQFRTSKSCNSPEVGITSGRSGTYNSEQGHMAVVDLYFVCHKSANSLMLIYLIDTNFWSQNKTSSIIHYHPSVPFWRQVTAQNPWSHKRASCVVGFKWKSLRLGKSPGLSLLGYLEKPTRSLGFVDWYCFHDVPFINLQQETEIFSKFLSTYVGCIPKQNQFVLRGTRRDFSIKSLRAVLLSCLSLSQYQTQKMKPPVTSSSWNDIVVEWYHRNYVNHMFFKQHHTRLHVV